MIAAAGLTAIAVVSAALAVIMIAENEWDLAGYCGAFFAIAIVAAWWMLP